MCTPIVSNANVRNVVPATFSANDRKFRSSYRTIYKLKRTIRCRKIYHGILTRALDRWPAFYHGKWKYIRAPFSERINFRLSLLRASMSFLLVDSKDRPLEISFSLVRFQFPFRPRNFTTPLAPGITNQDRAHLVPSLHFYFSPLSCFLFARRARNADGPARDSDFCEL